MRDIMLNKMKKFQFLALSLFAVFVCVSFASCSDDDKDEPTADIVGTWECITGEDHGAGYDGEDFEKGTLLKLLKGDKCFIGYNGSFEIYNPDTDRWETVTNPTENQWGDEDGEGDKWYLKGNVLTVVESDLDRYVGTINVNGNEMTFTYKYQNWNYDSGTMTSESETYVSKFRKK